MFPLEAPRDLLQITDGTPRPKQAVERANPAVWVRTLVRSNSRPRATCSGLLSCTAASITEPTDGRGNMNKPIKPWRKAFGTYMTESTLMRN